jgi:[acyl-carrier-protein] S-malonyltransferase
MRAFTFPGQGSQVPGMGRDLADSFAAARLVFEEVDEALQQKLSKLMFEGPAEELTLTANAQPALMAVSIAVLRVLESEAKLDLGSHVSFVAGHSLGEYSALAAAGTFKLADAARLLRLRGLAMQKAVPVGEGAMAALLGLDLAAAQEIAVAARANPETGKNDVCDCANDNAPGQVVVSGAKAAIERAVEIAKTKGAKRAMLLPVSAPFHCALMQPAADAMAQALADVRMAPPRIPLVANVTASAAHDAATIAKLLVEQVTGMVRWRECVSYMKAQGTTQIFELGAGKVLTGLAKRIEPDLTATALGGPADIEAFAKTL